MNITVRLPGGIANSHDGERICVDDGTHGHLYILGAEDVEVAIYAPGSWLYAEKAGAEFKPGDNGHAERVSLPDDPGWPEPRLSEGHP